jgi:hypothetical protein
MIQQKEFSIPANNILVGTRIINLAQCHGKIAKASMMLMLLLRRVDTNQS